MTINVNEVKNITLNGSEVKSISTSDGSVLWTKTPSTIPDYLCITNLSQSSGDFSLTKTGSPDNTLEYSYNGTDFTSYDMTNLPTVSVPAGGKLYLRGTSTSTMGDNTNVTINFTQNFKISGNMLSFVDKDNFETTTDITNLFSLFNKNTNIVYADEAHFGNGKDVKSYSLCNTFAECTSLITPPNTSTIETVANVGMPHFVYKSTALTECPDLSNLTTVYGSWSLSQFAEGCTNLVTPTKLDSLTTYSGYPFYHLYYGCTNLNYAYAPPVWVNSGGYGGTAFGYWLQNCASTGTVYKLSTVTNIPTNDYSGIPSGWTAVDTDVPQPMSITSATGTAFTVSISEVTDKSPTGKDVLYSTDGSTWSTLHIPDADDSSTLSIPTDGTVYFKNAGGYNTGWSVIYGDPYYRFNLSCASNDLIVNGDILSLYEASAYPSTITNGAFHGLFEGCTAISAIHIKNVATWSQDVWEDWLLNVAASGTIYKPSTLTIPSGTSGVPSGWSTINE